MFSFWKKIRFFFHLSSAFLRKHLKIILWAFILGVISVYFLPKIYNRFLNIRVERIGLIGKFSPSSLPSEVAEKISLGLTKIEQDKSVSGAIASSWSAEENGRRYRFNVRKDLKWHDQSALVCKDIIYSFSDVVSHCEGDDQLVFDLKEIFSPFPSVVSTPILRKGLIGLGPYRVVSLKLNGQIIEEISLRSITLNHKLIYRFYPTQSAAITGFKLGEVDQIHGVFDETDLKDWPQVEITKTVDKSNLVVLLLNTQNDFLSEKNIRQALAYSIKKDFISRALGPISSDSWAFNSGIKEYQYSQQKAKNLLDKGFAEVKLEQKPKLELVTSVVFLGLAESIKKDWQETLGLETEIKIADILPSQFQTLLVTQEIPPDPDQYYLWHSTQGRNLTGYRSPKIDKLLEDGRREFDIQKRKEIYSDFQRFLVEDSPAVFFYYPTVYQISRV